MPVTEPVILPANVDAQEAVPTLLAGIFVLDPALEILSLKTCQSKASKKGADDAEICGGWDVCCFDRNFVR